MTPQEKLIGEEVNQLRTIGNTAKTILSSYEELFHKITKRSQELDAETATLEKNKAKLRKEEKALISGMDALDAAQKKASSDQAHVDSQIKKYDKLVVEQQARATEAKHFESDLLARLIQEGVDAKLNKMMESQ